MSKLFRRTWERQRYGRAGAISSPLPARTGTDGAISGASFAAPVKVFTSATAAFVAGDVGRKIRITGTPSNRYNGLFVIDSINSGTSVNLRHNHNVGGTPTSDARFYENGSSIVWKILESCTFVADTAGDMEDFYAGSYIFIDSSNVANKGLWLISHRVDSQTVLLSKSYVYWITDNNPYTDYIIEATEDFQAQTGLRWYVIDRQPMSVPDRFELYIQYMIDAGWSMYQNRGHNTTIQSYRDVILKSTGEPDALIPGGKAMFYRYVMYGVRVGPQAVNTNALLTCCAVYQHWDATLTAVAPGQGSGGCRGAAGTNPIAVASGGGTTISSGSSGPWNLYPWRTGGISWLERGRSDIPDASVFWDYSWFGDRDEMFISENAHTTGISSQTWVRMQFGHFKTMGSNPNIVTAINNITSGANKDVNVGTVDITTLTPPYAVGDNITLIGRKSSSPAEYVETTTIVSFNNGDPSNRLVRVANVSMAFGNGPDTLKLQIGEDPFPVAVMESTNTTYVPHLHNLSKQAVTTSLFGSPGRDFDTVNMGNASTGFEIYAAGFANQDPNRKTGKHGLLAVGIRNDTNGEFRGRWRYYWDLPDYKWAMGTKFLVNSTDVYVACSPSTTGITVAMGPMTKAMAGIYT
jgi:hypothetical protein